MASGLAKGSSGSPHDAPTSNAERALPIGLLHALRDADIEVDDGTLTRALYAHDASNHRITPMAVAFPRSGDEVAAVVRHAHAFDMPVTARGAGTGMAGNAIGHGLVLDLRRHLDGIGPIVDDTVRVEPGVVLDDLQRALAPHRRMFGPDPSSRTRATIGGMVGNDACGNHSVAYGRTSDHVIELEIVLADGTRAIATRHGLRAIDPSDAPRLERLEARLRAIADAELTMVADAFDRSPRQVSGYAAHRLLPAHGFDIVRLLVGSEGTLAIVTAARLALVPTPASTTLVVIGYRDLVEAARDVPAILGFTPSAIEALDRAIVRTMRARRGEDAVPHMPDGDAWLFVEFADSVHDADPEAFMRSISAHGRAVSTRAVGDPSQRAALWRVREDGAGLASNLVDGRRGRPGWEDAAVPPHRLADYLADVGALADRHGYSGVLYGHFGAGCVHVRYDFDTATDDGRARMHAFLRDAAALVASHDGSISGEHGDGRARSEFLAAMYPPAALRAFRAIKLTFDPNGILNPGIIVDAPNAMADMPTPRADAGAAFRLADDAGSLAIAAGRCVGVGRCVATNLSAMCPTYQVTGLERDGTRGRARAIQDLFIEQALPMEAAVEALDGCLGCRACATDCPTGVDMATYKAEVLHRHFRGRRRPRTHYTLGWLPRLTTMIAPVAPLANWLFGVSATRRVLQRLAGITTARTLPRVSSHSRRRTLRREVSAPDAVLFIDSTTRAFAPEVAEAALRVLAAAQLRIATVTEGCCGLTYIASGQLDHAKREQRRLLDILGGAAPVVPIIVLEPSCAAALLHDLPALLDDPRAAVIAARVRTFATALDTLAPAWAWPRLPDSVVLQEHCHERATFAEHQAALLRRRGVTVQETVGCCGLAGAFGYEVQHHDLSIMVADRSLTPTIDAAPQDTVLADGFGCRCQVEHVRPRARTRHLAELLDDAL